MDLVDRNGKLHLICFHKAVLTKACSDSEIPWALSSCAAHIAVSNTRSTEQMAFSHKADI